MDHITFFIETTSGKFLLTVAAVVVLLAVKKIFSRFIYSNVEIVKKKFRFVYALNILFYTLIVIAILMIWLKDVKSLVTIVGLSTVALAIVLKEPILNFVSFFMIVWRDIFVVGDRIEVGSSAGDIIYKGLFYFTLLEIKKWDDGGQSTGRIIKVPNAVILTTPIINYTKYFEYVWNEINICVALKSDWRKARDILVSIASNYIEEQNIDQDSLLKKINSLYEDYMSCGKITPDVYVTLGDKGIVLTLRYLCHARKRRESEQYVWERVLDVLPVEENIEVVISTT